MSETFLRLPAVKARVGLSRSSIYNRIAEGTFPKPVSLGAKAVAWLESEISLWQATQIERARPSTEQSKRPHSSDATASV